jgi:fluoroacetyl-CoA thioesterase
MENSALDAIKPDLDPSESAVGTEINVRHLAPTVVGSIVTGEAEVTKIDGRRIEFRVHATEGDREIGLGSHSRGVVDMAKFIRRLGGV